MELNRLKKQIGRKYYHRVLNKYYGWKFHKTEYHPEKEIIYVDPQNIQYYLLSSTLTRDFRNFVKTDVPKHNLDKGTFSPHAFTGIVLSGNWDKYKKPYKFDKVYNGMLKHFNDDQNDQKSEYKQTYLTREEVRDQEGILRRTLDRKEKLYNSIEQEGYKSQYSLGEKNDTDRPYKRPSEICINIGRNGELIFNNSDAHHRLAIAKILGIDKVPVTVIVRHHKWEKVREEIAESTRYDQIGKEAKQHMLHPDVKYLLN